MNKEEKIEAYINIATMFGTKPTKELIKSIPKKDLVDVFYRLYEIIEEQEKRIDKAIEFIETTKNDDDLYIYEQNKAIMKCLLEILKGEDNES